MLEQLFQASRFVHIAAGVVGLASFWIAIFAPKGKRVHLKAGSTFKWGMYLVAISAWVISLMVVIFPETVHPGQDVNSNRVQVLFLSYLGLLTFTIVRHGVLVLRAKRNLSVLNTPLNKGLSITLLLASCGAVFLGIQNSLPHYLALGLVGLLNGTSQLRFILGKHRRSNLSMAWWYEHMNAMIGAGVAAHTGFLAGGGSRYVPWFIETFGWVGWIIPAAIGVPTSAIWIRRYRRQFNDLGAAKL